MNPTQEGFLAWVRTVMGITTAQLPDNSPWVGYAFNVAMELVNQVIQTVSPPIYLLAVYNLGGDNLINWAPDQVGQTFFVDARKSYGCLNFAAGVVASTGDSSTSTSLQVTDAMRDLTLGNLQNLKTPYGRQYLAFAQTYGSTIWGLS